MINVMEFFLESLNWAQVVQWIMFLGVFLGGMKISMKDLTKSIDHLTHSLSQLDNRLRDQEQNHARLDERTALMQESLSRVETRLGK